MREPAPGGGLATGALGRVGTRSAKVVWPPQVSLSAADPELCEGVPAEDRAVAERRLVAYGYRLRPGPVDLTRQPLPETTFALLVVTGRLTREVRVGGAALLELVLEGDIVLPWKPAPTAPLSELNLTALSEVQLVALDHRFISAAALWPALMVAVNKRLADREQRLATQGAICQLPRVEQRLMAIMWHLAARTGKVGADGTCIPWRLTHQTLADLVGSRRPTVTLAVKSLQQRGHISRRGDGTWVLPDAAEDSHHFDGLVANLDGI